MSSYADHVAQSWHNEAVANTLLRQPEDRDWAITVAFYTAVHLAEACFTKRTEIGHTEVVARKHKARTGKGLDKHRFREDQLKLLATDEAYQIYKALHEASQDLRYLTMQNNRKYLFETTYPQSEAMAFVTERLPKLRWELAKKFDVDGGLYAIEPT